MTEQTENLILEYMRRFDRQLKDFGDDVRELKVRMTNVEENLVGVQRRIDKVELRLERIERRLELTEA
jgi:hypothetical protein